MRKKFLLPLMVFCLLAFLSGSFVLAKAKEFSKSNATCIATYSEQPILSTKADIVLT
jgi:hypothetical protein